MCKKADSSILKPTNNVFVLSKSKFKIVILLGAESCKTIVPSELLGVRRSFGRFQVLFGVTRLATEQVLKYPIVFTEAPTPARMCEVREG